MGRGFLSSIGHATGALKVVGAIVGGLSVCLGIVTGVLYPFPVVSVEQKEPLDPNNVLSVPFVVTNTAPYTLSEVYSACEVNYMWMHVSTPSAITWVSPNALAHYNQATADLFLAMQGLISPVRL